MTDREKKALEVLTRVRACYIDRITDFVLENEEELMGQAQGEVVFGNTEELSEISEKLRQLLVVIESYRSSLAEKESQTHIAAQPQITFEVWEYHVINGAWDEATATLAILFQISIATAMACMEFFVHRLREGFDMKPPIDELRATVKTNPARAIVLLRECFGLRGEAAVYVFNNLQEGNV